jgi:hypothetical protein
VVNRDDNPSGAAGAVASVTITTTTLPNGTVGTAYSQQLTLVAVGGMSPYMWDNTAGTMPPGLNFSADGVISGTPTTAGTYSFTVEVVDSNAVSDTQVLSITVGPALPGGQFSVDISGAAIADSYVNSGAATTNYSTGTELKLYQWPAATPGNKSVVTVDISSIPDNAAVTDAKLYLYNLPTYEGSGGTNPMRAHIYTVPTLTPSTVTWNTLSASQTEVTASLTEIPLTEGWVAIPLTSIVQSAYAGDKTVRIVISGSVDGASDTNRALSSNNASANKPYLSVKYIALVGPGGPSISAPGKARVSKLRGVIR